MSLSSLITPFRTPPIEQWSLHQDVENFIEWRDTHSTDVLCVYGDSDLQETSEQLFYVLDQQRSRGPGHGEVLYFSFNRHDTTHNTLKDMLATFIAQMICHCTNWMRLMAHSMFVQFSEERGWTDQDLLQWFDACSNLLLTSSAYLVIHGFDECSDSNRKAFIDWFDHMTAAREQPWKLAFTSQQPLQLDSAQISMSNWRHINMAGSHHNASLDFVRSIERKSMVLRHRPEVFLEYDNLLESIDLIAQGDKLIQEIVLAHALSVPGWPQTHSLEDIFGPLPHHLSSEGTLMFTLDHVLRRLSAKENVRTLLLWLLYSARPLSLWELVSVARPDCVNNGDASPQPDIMRGFTQMCETQLRGIVDIRDTQVCFRHPGLRELLRKSISRSSDAYIWNDLDESKVNYDITETCLRFLARDDVQQELEFRAHETILGEMPRYGLASGYTNFCSYAAYYWPRHAKAALSRGSLDISSLLENYKQPALTAAWMKYFWCLSNPVTRSKEPLESLDALLAGLGLLNALGGLPDLDARNIIFAAQEAAARRSSKLVKKLLYRCEQPNSEELVDILKAAASSGSEKLVLDVFQHITNTISDKGAVRWPPCLLYRAAWMGMDQFAGQLLEAGCLSADPGGPMAEKPRISPLHLAVRHGHTACIKTLLSHGADTGFLALSNRNVLFSAANSGRAEVFEILFEMGRQSLTDKDKNDETPLEFAASCGLKAAVKSLLRMGADPYDGKDISAADVGWLPLINAASRGRTECIRILLDHDADPNQPGPGGEDTAIYFAVGNNFPSTLRVLLERGADPNHHLLWKIPPIAQVVLATKWENGPGIPLADKIKMIDMLIEFKGRVDATDSEGRTALMDAIRAGDESIVAHLLELGASVHSMDSYKQSPLHYVPATGSEAILKMILAKGPDLDHLNNDGCSPLRLSVRFANMVSILLEHGAKPDLSDHEGYTPLMVAATWGHYESVKLLLDHHADVNLRSVEADGTGVTAVFWAAEDDHPDIVKMLADAGANLSHKYRAGLTALHVASPAAAAVLLQYRKRLDIDASADLNGSKWTPLHRAIYSHKSMELVKLLVNNGASLQALDRDGDTPLGLAVIAKNHEAVKILLREEDCDLKIASHRGRTPLHYATDHETMETLQLLVERGADVNQTAKSAYGSPLQKACQNNKMGQAMIEFLLEKGADLHARGGTLGFAISSAALYGTSEIIGLLLQRGATVNVQDDMGRKPIHLSCMGGADNFQEIYDAGGNQHLQDKDNLGRTAFHWAAQHGQPEILEKLIAELGTSLLDKPDVDGWTPLMWTCLPHFNSEEDADEGRKRRKRVFQMLIEQGARPNAIGKIGDTWWSLRDIMVYNDIDRECLALVDKALATVQPTVTSVTTEAGQARRIGALKSEGSWECDACYCVSTYWTVWLRYFATSHGARWHFMIPSLLFSLPFYHTPVFSVPYLPLSSLLVHPRPQTHLSRVLRGPLQQMLLAQRPRS